MTREQYFPQQSHLSPEMEFFIYLLERYSSYKNTTGDKVFQEWSEHNLVQWIYDNYWGYHTETLENAFKDIDSMLATGKPAW
jgi:hypothetical protein